MRYYGQFNPPVDEIIHKHVQFRDDFFIECGAYDGKADSNCKFLEESLGWTGINIEASPSLYELLKVNRPNSINLNYALSDYCGIATFTKSYRGNCEVGLGSLDRSVIIEQEKGDDIEVEVIDWEYLIESYSLSKVDLFSLDIENHELVVLKDMIKSSILPIWLVVEHGHVGQDNIVKIIQNKYELVETYVNNSIFRLSK